MRKIGVGDFQATQPMIDNVLEVLKSNRLSYGPFSERFEKLFASLHGYNHGVFVNSGTSALHLAIAVCKEKYGWKDGDEIIVPALTFVATINTVLHNKLVPVFIDVDPGNFNIDVNLIESAITPRTRAIIPVHIAGVSCDMETIETIAMTHSLIVIEDSCEAAFCRIQHGTAKDIFVTKNAGLISCFSTYVAHHIQTGVGGLALTSDPNIAIMIRSLANHGRDPAYMTIDSDITQDVINKRFSFVSLGHSFRSTELQAAIGLPQLENWRSMVSSRLQNVANLGAYFDKMSEYFKFLPRGFLNSWMRPLMFFPIVSNLHEKSDIVNFLEVNGIETRDLLPIITQPVYRNIGISFDINKFPVAHHLARFAFYIGCHPSISQDDMRHIENVFDSFLEAEKVKYASDMKRTVIKV